MLTDKYITGECQYNCQNVSIFQSHSVVYWLMCLPLDLRFAGSNPVQDDGFLRAIKIRSTTSFGGNVTPSVPCRKSLQHVKETYKYERDIL
jgi:hypothetical protein